MPNAPRYQSHGRYKAWRVAVTVIARAVSRAIATVNEIEILRQFVLFCAAGLFVGLLMLTYGIDLSPGLF